MLKWLKNLAETLGKMEFRKGINAETDRILEIVTGVNDGRE